jgi:hypothetical protein
MAADSETKAQGTEHGHVQLADAPETDADAGYTDVQSNGTATDAQSNGNATEAQSNGVEQHEAHDGQQVDQEQEQAVENVFQLTIHLPHAPVRRSPLLLHRPI